MDDSPNLSLPYLAAQQAQKHVTHNAALRKLDALAQLVVLDRTRTAPPPLSADGDRHIVAAPASDVFEDHENEIAAFQDGAWIFYGPRPGWRAFCLDEERLLVFDGLAWNDVEATPLNPSPLVGVNATADATNRLAVKSPNSLFDHDGEGHRLKINKSAAAETAGVLLQNGYSGRAEIGLLGDDDLHLKVSADGAAWTEALVIDKDDGVLHSVPRLIVGAAALVSNGFLQVTRDDFCEAHITSHSAGGSASMVGYRSRGAFASPSIVADADFLFSFFARGYDGAAYRNAAGIRFAVDGTPGSNDMPGRITFHTSQDGTTSFAERMRITQAGDVGVGVTAPSCKLHVDGPVRVKSYTVATVPSASSSGAGAIVYVSDESGGAVLAFSDGTNWRRVTDRAAIS
jgi:hypothetical protein